MESEKLRAHRYCAGLSRLALLCSSSGSIGTRKRASRLSFSTNDNQSLDQRQPIIDFDGASDESFEPEEVASAKPHAKREGAKTESVRRHRSGGEGGPYLSFRRGACGLTFAHRSRSRKSGWR